MKCSWRLLLKAFLRQHEIGLQGLAHGEKRLGRDTGCRDGGEHSNSAGSVFVCASKIMRRDRKSGNSGRGRVNNSRCKY
ncbi:hypothetical protein ACFX2B_045511 [Malus domestica]